MADNQAPDRDKNVVTFERFSGLRNDVTAERFESGDLAVASNIDIDKSGRIARRAGYTSLVTGSRHSLWANDRESICLFVNGNQLMQLTTAFGSVAIATLQGVGMKMSYQEVNETIYFTNGIDKGVFENGALRSWGLEVPPVPGAAVTVGQMPAGIYQFVMTYFRNDDQESGAPLAGVIVVPQGGGLNFSLPVSADPTVTSKGLYVSTPNGDDLYLAAMLPNAALTAQYTNDTTELELPLSTQFMGPPPAGQLLAYYRGHTYVAVGDTIYPSTEFGYELFDLRNYIQLTGYVTLLAPMEDKERGGEGQHSGFFAGTDESCGTIVGSAPEDFQYVPKTVYGAVFGALDYVDGSLFADNSAGARVLPMWLTTQGICVGMPDMEIRNLTRTKYGFPASGQGAAIFMPGPNRFIANSIY